MNVIDKFDRIRPFDDTGSNRQEKPDPVTILKKNNVRPKNPLCFFLKKRMLLLLSGQKWIRIRPKYPDPT